jgi:hypothetical protein
MPVNQEIVDAARRAGLDEEQMAGVLADPNAAAYLLRNAGSIPVAEDELEMSSYWEALSNFQEVETATLRRSGRVVPTSEPHIPSTEKPYTIKRNEAGETLVLYNSGAIANVTTGTVLFPDAKQQRDVKGSPEWLGKVQESWSEDKVAEWRKKLAKFGYLDVAEGGWAQDLVVGLATFHHR